jgi:hypothetical protein
MLRVAFAGLPSAGKSTMINSIAGKRVLESGVCRTTTEVCVVGAKPLRIPGARFVQADLRSDDGVEFCALDLPGVCDAEDATGSFDSVTLDRIAECDVVVWVTDARTAFVTNHEVAALGRVRSELERLSEEGVLCHLAIVLSKYEAPRTHTRRTIELLDGEIGTYTEESTVEHSVERAKRMFDDAVIVKFNAFDRIMRTGSEALRALVPRTHAVSDGFEQWPLKWATENVTERRLELLTRVLRNTRLRAIAAERSVCVLMSRVAPSPVYDTPFEFLFVRRTGTVSAVSETTVFSLPVMMDSAVDDKLLCGIESEKVYMHHGFISSGVGICNRARLEQLIAPLVRPVYGDVFVVPLSATYNASHTCAIVQSCFKEHWGVWADDSGANTKYVLKVGEASPGHLRELVALGPKGLCLRCIKK